MTRKADLSRLRSSGDRRKRRLECSIRIMTIRRFILRITVSCALNGTEICFVMTALSLSCFRRSRMRRRHPGEKCS